MRGATKLTIGMVAVFAMVLAACGEDVVDEPPAEDEPTETEEVVEDEPDDGEPEEAVDVEERTLRFAYITPETFPYQDGAERFKELVEERSGGAITVELFPGAELGGERDINEGILEGSIHIGIGAGALAALAPIQNLTQLPFIVANQDHMHAIIESEAGDEIASRIEDAGFKVLDFFSTGDSALQTTDQAIETPDDLSGVRIRAIENQAIVDALEALGANPTPMPYPEIYTGLQQGVIEGAHLDWGSVASLRVYELIDYSTGPDVAFLAEPRPVIMSMEFWESLDAQTQEIIQDAMTEAAEYERQVFLDVIDDAIATVEEAGVTFTDIDADAFIEIVEPVWQEWAEQLDAVELLEMINDLRP